MTTDILGSMTAAPGPAYVPCRIAMLPDHAIVDAARLAGEVNPTNRPMLAMAPARGVDPCVLTPYHLAVLTGKFWKAGQVVTVGFLDNPDATTRRLILAHANIWRDKGVNLGFVESATDPMVRVARLPGQGYWSYLGTDILSVPANEQTMNLEGFTASTSIGEYLRVVCHEFGHTMGFPHEAGLPDAQAMIDPNKALAYYEQWQGWSAQMVRDQVLTTLAGGSFRSTPHADVLSIMMYPFPANITRNGVAIPGGTEIDASDAAFACSVYPGLATSSPPPTPPPAPAGGGRVDVAGWIGIKGSTIRGLVGTVGQQPYDFQVACRPATPTPPQSAGEHFYAIAGQAQPNAASGSAVTVDPAPDDGDEEDDGP